jgi:hypothetical protein
MKDCGNHPSTPETRREFLTNFGNGIGGLALASLYGINPYTAEAVSPTLVKDPHFPVKAKAIIHLFAGGAPSSVDTFDYKPELQKNDGKKMEYGELLASPFQFNKSGKSGIEISEVWSELSKHADDMAIINSMFAEIPDHGIASKIIHTGSAQLSKPSLGSWIVYGLGTVNQNMPGFICLNGSSVSRQCAFLPGIYQGCNIDYKPNASAEQLLNNIKSQFSSLERQRRQLDLTKNLNLFHMQQLQNDIQLESRIEAFETAFRMQTEATDVFDLSKEPENIREMYGNNNNGSRLLLARRLVERGVRFVQVNIGGFDHHENIREAMPRTTRTQDQAISALIADLKQRGLFDSTLILWGGEFGRTVTAGGSAGAPGRDHNGKAFSVWMAGGGVKGGQRYGETDETGGKAEKDKVHVHDLHATILQLMGFDHTKLIYTYNGRPFRLTDVYGNVIKEIVS